MSFYHNYKKSESLAMRIAAIYIPGGYLPHVFGKGHAEQTINLGGRFLYTISDSQITDVKLNSFYLDDILNDKVSLFSCIVGSNGGGKTSILKLITSDWNCLYVVENDTDKYWLTESPEDFHRIYYTPYLNDAAFNSIRANGKDLSKYSLIKNDNHGDSGQLVDFLEAHFSENIKRWIKFNHFFRGQNKTKVTLPTFRKVILSLKHFDLTVQQPDRFHNTAYQLRPSIKIILKKIEAEAAAQEIKALEGYDPRDPDSQLIYFPVRFKYDLFELSLAKLVSIFERQGNQYLQEGIIPEDFEAQLENLDVRSSIEWFLLNAGVHSGQSNYYLHKHVGLLELIDYIVSLIDPQRTTDNWGDMIIEESEALRIIELYDEFNESFQNDWFEVDFKPIFGFRPDIAVSSGEQSFLNLFSTLYYHAGNIRGGIEIDEYNYDSLKNVKEDILILLDEGDNAFHPQWKKAYVKYLRELVPIIFEGFRIQIVITSHDPLTLSDLPKNNVVYLERIDGRTRIGSSSLKRTFGANIADLLKDSFFIQDGQIGDFVAGEIDDLIEDIRNRQISATRKSEMERIIRVIDEPILKFKLAEMLSEALGDRQFELDLIDEEIRRLERRRRREI
ncbi:hypothetical protein [Mucilaginibacter sp. SJ]|uniref:hypothetical protein n=1 Tax=Mucilaginibacter sp. SJ TaxID=3029053 RepID=UPI0023A95A25|nr:hypothetical protein [Mucilaginibacter sp. SJ]WEA00716.1 hypothetical protein MusilaSJ_25000 [Mucilaginibacter sp. SJ]